MTDPRLHMLAKQAAARIELGHAPLEAILAALLEATGKDSPHPFYDQFPARARSICLALWGEPPMRTRDVHKVIGGSMHSIHTLLYRLRMIGIVCRPKYGHYTVTHPNLLQAMPQRFTIRHELLKRGLVA